MGDRCYSTVVCAERDKDVFEKMGYILEDSKPLAVDGTEIPGAVLMVDEQANYGNHDELTALKGIPFWACSDPCPGAFGAEIIVSDGNDCRCSEASTKAITLLSELNLTGQSGPLRSTTQRHTGSCMQLPWLQSREPRSRDQMEE